MPDPERIEIRGPLTAEVEQILTPAALAFVAQLHRQFNPTREALLARRAVRQQAIEAGALPD
ncbi:MAG TPA: malate synthase A, partial [Chloroflexia bacterium]|nr:malate synthase A [Chloroflexia bacterium]